MSSSSGSTSSGGSGSGSGSKKPFTSGEAHNTVKSRAQYPRYKPPKTPPTDQHNGHHATDGTERHYAWNDQGNARRLLDAGGRDRLRYVAKRTFPWSYWDGTCWPEDRTNYVGQWLEQVLHAAYNDAWMPKLPRAAQVDEAKFLLRSLDSPKIAAALTAVARHVTVTRDAFDTHDWLLPCANGLTYDMATGDVLPSQPAHYMTRRVPVDALSEAAPHPKYDRFMRLLFGGHTDSADLLAYVEWIIALALTGYTREKTVWFWQGETNAGKTTLLSLVEWLCGPYVYSIPLRALLKARQDTGILHDIAGTEGMRFVFAEEFRPGDVLDSAWVKKLTGQGSITADRKGEPNVTFVSKAKIVIGTNTMPTLADVDSALRGRIRVVPFPNNVPDLLRAAGQPVRSMQEVIDDLKDEGAAILHHLVQTVARWNTNGRSMPLPAGVAQASQQYLATQDLLADWLATCFELQRDGSLTRETIELPLLTWYWSYLKQSGRSDTRGLYQAFGELLTGKGFSKRRTAKGWYFTGPSLTREAQGIAEDAAWGAEREAERLRAYRGY